MLGIARAAVTAITKMPTLSIDHRVKAIATASAVNTSVSARKGWEGKGSTAELFATLDAISKQRAAGAARPPGRLRALRPTGHRRCGGE